MRSFLSETKTRPTEDTSADMFGYKYDLAAAGCVVYTEVKTIFSLDAGVHLNGQQAL
jgi:hypothetical protein